MHRLKGIVAAASSLLQHSISISPTRGSYSGGNHGPLKVIAAGTKRERRKRRGDRKYKKKRRPEPTPCFPKHPRTHPQTHALTLTHQPSPTDTHPPSNTLYSHVTLPNLLPFLPVLSYLVLPCLILSCLVLSCLLLLLSCLSVLYPLSVLPCLILSYLVSLALP